MKHDDKFLRIHSPALPFPSPRRHENSAEHCRRLGFQRYNRLCSALFVSATNATLGFAVVFAVAVALSLPTLSDAMHSRCRCRPCATQDNHVMWTPFFFVPVNPLGADGIVCACNTGPLQHTWTWAFAGTLDLDYMVRLVRNSPNRANIVLRDLGLFIYIAHKEAPNYRRGGCDFAFRLTWR